MKRGLTSLLLLASIGCGVHIGNGRSGDNKVTPTPVAQTFSLACDVIDAQAGEVYYDLGCSLKDQNNGVVKEAKHSFVNTDQTVTVTVQPDAATYGVKYRVAGSSKKQSLEGLRKLTVEATYLTYNVSSSATAAAGNVWVVDPDAIAEGGGCKGESCVMQGLINKRYYVRSSLGLHNFEEATASCANLNYGGYEDWRLPTIVELSADVASGLAVAKGFSTRFAQNFAETAVYWAGDDGKASFTWNIKSQSGSASVSERAQTLGVLCTR